jgi:hypothetical protein
VDPSKQYIGYELERFAIMIRVAEASVSARFSWWIRGVAERERLKFGARQDKARSVDACVCEWLQRGNAARNRVERTTVGRVSSVKGVTQMHKKRTFLRNVSGREVRYRAHKGEKQGARSPPLRRYLPSRWRVTDMPDAPKIIVPDRTFPHRPHLSTQ